MTDVSALILAGGRSAGFGRDKTQAVWQGQTLLGQGIELAQSFSDDVIVLSAWTRHQIETATDPGVRVLHDPEPFAGPLVAVATGLVHVQHDLCLVLAADLPPSAQQLRRLIKAAVADPTTSAFALEFDGGPRTLPLLIRARFAYPYLTRVVSAGERRLRAVLDTPGALTIPQRAWQPGGRRQAASNEIQTPADHPDFVVQPSSTPATVI